MLAKNTFFLVYEFGTNRQKIRLAKCKKTVLFKYFYENNKGHSFEEWVVNQIVGAVKQIFETNFNKIVGVLILKT